MEGRSHEISRTLKDKSQKKAVSNDSASFHVGSWSLLDISGPGSFSFYSKLHGSGTEDLQKQCYITQRPGITRF